MNQENDTKNLLKNLGVRLRRSNPIHQEHLRALLTQKIGDEKKSVRLAGFWSPLRIFAFSGSAVMAVLLLIVLLPRQQMGVATSFADLAPQMPMAAPGFGEEKTMDDSEISYGASVGLSASSEASHGRAPRPPVPDQVLEGEMQNYIQDHGNLLKTSLLFQIKTKEKNAHVSIMNIFDAVGGYVISGYGDDTQNGTVMGKIPTRSLDVFKSQLEQLAPDPSFLSLSQTAQSRVSDVVAFDKVIEEIQQNVSAIEEQLAHETNTWTKAELQGQLDQANRLLADRKVAKEDLLKSVDMIVVTVSVTRVSSPWNARSYEQTVNSIVGFDEPTLSQTLLINLIYACTRLIRFFSATFWFLIPIGVWLAYRSRRKKQWRELE
jgi:hypothetical protein